MNPNLPDGLLCRQNFEATKPIDFGHWESTASSAGAARLLVPGFLSPVLRGGVANLSRNAVADGAGLSQRAQPGKLHCTESVLPILARLVTTPRSARACSSVWTSMCAAP